MAPETSTQTTTTRLAASSNTSSRRTSQIMGPPTIPASAHIANMSASEQAGLPMRHPRPLTAAELYMECEKEQEAMIQVNRLTRELTALRAQTASVASNASQSSTSTSTSLLPVDITDRNPTHQLVGATHPTPSRRHRSSSSLSTRSGFTPSTTNSTTSTSAVHSHTAQPLTTHAISQASADRAAAVGAPPSLSRQPSVSASGASTPARQSLDMIRQPPTATYTQLHRPQAISRDPSQTTISSTLAQAGTPNPAQPSISSSSSPLVSPHNPPSSFNPTASLDHSTRSELDLVKAENEVLRQQVRALQRALRAQRPRRDSTHSETSIVTSPPLMSQQHQNHVSQSLSPVAAWAASDGGVGGVAGPREGSESQSTSASSRRGGPGGALGVPEEDLKVGESANCGGIGR